MEHEFTTLLFEVISSYLSVQLIKIKKHYNFSKLLNEHNMKNYTVDKHTFIFTRITNLNLGLKEFCINTRVGNFWCWGHQQNLYPVEAPM